MISGTAGNNINLFHCLNFLIRHIQLVNHNISVFDTGRNGIGNGPRLFVNFL